MPYKPAPLAPEFSVFTRISESDSTCIVSKPFRWHRTHPSPAMFRCSAHAASDLTTAVLGGDTTSAWGCFIFF
ncbi:unnamed protein product [Brassica oleracea var. botrytis]